VEKNLLLSGLGYSEENFALMEKELNSYGINNIIDFGSYIKYTKKSDEELVQSICEDFDILTENNSTNIICHSMGCNIGLILAKEKAVQIKKAVFLSPELQKTTRQEKKIAKLRIIQGATNSSFAAVDCSGFYGTKPTFDLSNEQPAKIGAFDKLSLFKVFNQTKRLAIESLKDIDTLESFIAYGIADKFVSQEGAEKLAKELDGTIMQICTRHHNLLLSSWGNETAKQITKFLKR